MAELDILIRFDTVANFIIEYGEIAIEDRYGEYVRLQEALDRARFSLNKLEKSVIYETIKRADSSFKSSICFRTVFNSLYEEYEEIVQSLNGSGIELVRESLSDDVPFEDVKDLILRNSDRQIPQQQVLVNIFL